MVLSPILLFTYNRPLHTEKTLEALRGNYLSSESELYVFSDGYKSESDKGDVMRVREIIRSIDGFKKVHIHEQPRNVGLAGNIIEGVTKIVNEFGKVIVLEDDLVTSPYFLTFMNEGLERYENEERVGHIQGFCSLWDFVALTNCFIARGCPAGRGIGNALVKFFLASV